MSVFEPDLRLRNAITEVAERRIEATEPPVLSVLDCWISSSGWKAVSHWAALATQSSAPSKCLRLQLPKPFAQSDLIYFQAANESSHYTMAGPHLEHPDRRCTSTDHLYKGQRERRNSLWWAALFLLLWDHDCLQKSFFSLPRATLDLWLLLVRAF